MLLVHGLAVVTNAVGLPGLIKGLEVEQINTPGEHATHTGLPEGLGVSGTSLGSLIIRAAVYKFVSYDISCAGSIKFWSYRWASQSLH